MKKGLVDQTWQELCRKVGEALEKWNIADPLYEEARWLEYQAAKAELTAYLTEKRQGGALQYA
jgi:hypothetical protein